LQRPLAGLIPHGRPYGARALIVIEICARLLKKERQL
jgi:hypothetical protein